MSRGSIWLLCASLACSVPSAAAAGSRSPGKSFSGSEKHRSAGPVRRGRGRPAHRQRPRHAGARPNVLIVVADDLGWNDVGYHGSVIRTPNIDSLARDGVALERFYANPICSPTRAELLSGMAPIRVGVQYWNVAGFGAGMPGHVYTLAERFRDAGYQTGLIGKWHLGRSFSEFLPNLQGFDYFYGSVGSLIGYFSHAFGAILDWQRNGRAVRESGYATTLQGVDAARYIRERDPDRPFFLTLAFNAPHWPVHSPRAARREYGWFCAFDAVRCLFAPMVTVLDAELGRVLRTIDVEGIREETIVVFMSDNGGDLSTGSSNQPLRGEKGTLYEGGIRVPAVVRWPGVIAPGVSHTPLRAFDWYATLEAAAGLRRRAPRDSANQLPAFLDAPRRRGRSFFWALDNNFASRPEKGSKVRAMMRGRWKLVTHDFEQLDGSLERRFELFDLEADPNEEFDRSEAYPRLVQRMDARIERWERLHPEGGARFGVLQAPPPRAPLTSFTEDLQDPWVLEEYQQRNGIF